jgi:hypothetical protein
VYLAFLIAALNELEILSADVQNAYLNAPTKKKIYTIAGPEFGQGKEGWPVMIVQALYGLRSSGAWWHDHLGATLREAGFKACKADTDVWMRPAIKADGSKYYEYVLCYVDDILVVSEHPKRNMEGLEAKYMLKAGSVGEPTTYLRAKVSKYWLEHSDNPDKVHWSLSATSIVQSRMWRLSWRRSGRCCRPRSQLQLQTNQVRWSLSAEDYVNRAVKDVETELEKVSKALPTKVTTPTTADYRPKLDQSKEL